MSDCLELTLLQVPEVVLRSGPLRPVLGREQEVEFAESMAESEGRLGMYSSTRNYVLMVLIACWLELHSRQLANQV